MNLVIGLNGVRIGRDSSDKAISKESTVTHNLRKLLNASGGPGCWVRFYPDRHGLTSCRQGVRNTKTGVIYWHERYQIEAAHKAFNAGEVYYLRA